MHEALGQLEARALLAEDRVVAARARPRSVTSAWSVGMLNVHQWNSTSKPSASVGTTKPVMPERVAVLA